MIRMGEAERRRVRELEREKKAIERPFREAARKARAADGRDREKRRGKVEGQRAKRERDPSFLAYLRRQPCCVGPILRDGCEGPTDPAHLRFTDRSVGRTNPGMGRKSDDRWCLPACRKHHEAQHRYGNEAKWWAEVVKADPNALAQTFYATYKGVEN
jgi:hypothetical protein